MAVEVDIRFPEGTNEGLAGVGCANSSSSAGYLFSLSPDGGFLVQRLVGTEFERLRVGRTEAQPTTETVRIRGECRAGFGDHELRMFVDGRPVATVAVAPGVREFNAVTLTTGSTDGNPPHARFDNVMAIPIQPSA